MPDVPDSTFLTECIGGAASDGISEAYEVSATCDQVCEGMFAECVASYVMESSKRSHTYCGEHSENCSNPSFSLCYEGWCSKASCFGIETLMPGDCGEVVLFEKNPVLSMRCECR